MQSLEVEGYSETKIRSFLLDNRKIGFEYELLDKNDRYLGEICCDCRMTHQAEAAIKRSASFTVHEKLAKEIDFLSDRIRPYICLYLPDGHKIRWSKGIFLLSSPERTEQDNGIVRQIEAYDKCLILSQDRFSSRHLLSAGSNITESVKSIITDCGITNFEWMNRLFACGRGKSLISVQVNWMQLTPC